MDIPERFEIEERPDPEDLAFLEEMVIASTRAKTDLADDRELAIFVRDDAGAIVAGINGVTWGGCCELQYLWVDEAFTRHGLGSALLGAAEAEARQRGCRQALFFTHDVQAPGFYERAGYVAVGVLEDYPIGSAARWFRKVL